MQDTVHTTIRDELRKQLEEFKFARCSGYRLSNRTQPPTHKYYFPSVEDPTCIQYTNECLIDIQGKDVFTQKTINKHIASYVEEGYAIIYCSEIARTPQPLFGTTVPQQPFRFHTKHQKELTFVGGEFTLTPLTKGSVLPFVSYEKKLLSDIICYIPTPGFPPGFWDWFICSEQFMRLWTLIMFDSHPSYVKNGKPKTILGMKKHLTSGNRLVTDAWLRYTQACEQNEVDVNHDESVRRFYVKRHERIPGIDSYVALVLAAVYNEKPTSENVPSLGVGGPIEELQRKEWDISPHVIDFIDRFQ